MDEFDDEQAEASRFIVEIAAPRFSVICRQGDASGREYWNRLTWAARERPGESSTLATKLLAALWRDITLLRDAAVPYVEERVAELTTRFLGTTHELHTAAYFVRAENEVEFIPESNEPGVRRPDFILNDQVEVECKVTGLETDEDVRVGELFRQIGDELSAFRASHPDAHGLAVEQVCRMNLTFHRRPDQPAADAVLTGARRWFEGNVDDARAANPAFTYEIFPSDQPPATWTQSGAAPEIEPDLRYDNEAHSHSGVNLPEPIAMTQATYFLNEVGDDHVRMARSRMKKAVTQFSGEGEGKGAIIALECSGMVGDLARGPRGRLRAIIDEIHRNNTRVSATQVWHEDWPNGLWTRTYHQIDNPAARVSIRTAT